MKLKRCIWFAEQDIEAALNGPHLGLELLRFDLKHLLVAYLNQFKPLQPSCYLSATSKK